VIEPRLVGIYQRFLIGIFPCWLLTARRRLRRVIRAKAVRALQPRMSVAPRKRQLATEERRVRLKQTADVGDAG
jgi:hypothetical protein